MKIAADLLRRGHRIAFPFGEDWDFDLVLYRESGFERVQVKHARSDGRVMRVPCYSRSLTSGKILRTKCYTAATIDWLAVYDATTDRCLHIPAEKLGEGRREMWLRITPALNGQRAGINDAADFTELPGK